jgi:hypothetical protein
MGEVTIMLTCDMHVHRHAVGGVSGEISRRVASVRVLVVIVDGDIRRIRVMDIDWRIGCGCGSRSRVTGNRDSGAACGTVKGFLTTDGSTTRASWTVCGDLGYYELASEKREGMNGRPNLRPEDLH